MQWISAEAGKGCFTVMNPLILSSTVATNVGTERYPTY